MAWEIIICWKLNSGKGEEPTKLYAPPASLNFYFYVLYNNSSISLFQSKLVT